MALRRFACWLVVQHKLNQRTKGPVKLTWHMIMQGESLHFFHSFKHPGYKFWLHFKAFIISIILYQFQKDRFVLDLLLYMIFCIISCMYIMGTIFSWKQKVLSLIACFINISLVPDFMHIILMILYMYIAPARAEIHWGQTFYVNKKTLSLWSFNCYKFQKNLFNLLFYTHLLRDLINVYSRGPGAEPPGNKILL